MGGLDLMDRLISYYPMRFRTKRWPTRVIFNLFTMSLANAWIEYDERRKRKKGMKRNQILDPLLSFREDVGHALCKAELSPICVSGRPSFQSLLNYCPIPEKKAPPAIRPFSDIRYDGFDHWPEATQIKFVQQCKLEHSNKTGRVRCMKCNIYICLNGERNCFKEFQTT